MQPPRLCFAADKKLIVRGFRLDTVSYVCNSNYLVSAVEPHFECGFKFAAVFEAHMNKQEPYPSGEGNLQVFARVLVMDNRTISSHPFLGRSTGREVLHDAFLKRGSWILAMGLDPLSGLRATCVLPESGNEISLHYYMALGSVSKGRSLFVAKTGYIGLRPSVVREGDQVCVLLGAQTPFIIRPQTMPMN
jgi:hypothetical protein